MRELALRVVAVWSIFMSGCAITPLHSSIKLGIKLYEAPDIIFEVDHWYAVLKPNQALLGSAIIRLKRVEDEFGELTEEEMIELRNTIKLMERAAKNGFGASHINWSCLMNYGYRFQPFPVALVHVHFRPRYTKKKVQFAGLEFYDDYPARHYKLHTMRRVPGSVRKEIIRVYQREIMLQAAGNHGLQITFSK